MLSGVTPEPAPARAPTQAPRDTRAAPRSQWPDARPSPKIELHVHLEGTVRPARLLEIAHRNDVALPVATSDELAELYRFRDFEHFIEIWTLTTAALQRHDDFRQVVVDYAEEAARQGAVYLEAIFSPAEPVRRGADWSEVFGGYCDGASEARDRFGIEVRLTPDIPRGFTVAEGEETARRAVRFRERGVVGLGLGGSEAMYPPEPFARAFAIARDGGVGSVPHAGEVAGEASIRGCLDVLHADRLRHGIRAVESPALLRELAERGTVLDVCPTSNLRTGAVASLDEHPLPALVAAGISCTVNTDDPAMFGTDLAHEHEIATRLGVDARAAWNAGLAGALCDEATRERLRAVGAAAFGPGELPADAAARMHGA